MLPRARTALAPLAAFACVAGGAAVAEAPATRPLDADEAPLAALTLALAAAPVPPLGEPGLGDDAAAPEPRVDLAVTFAAQSVVFEELPRIRMTFGRPGPPRAAWRVERRNLPVRVASGVEYRDVEVRLTLSSTLDEFESLIEDARSVAGGLRVESPPAPRGGNDQPYQRPRVSARRRIDAMNARRARAGLLPRKSPPGMAAPGSSRAVPSAAPQPANAAVVEKPGVEAAFPLVDVVLAAMRSRFPAADADASGGRVRADTSLENLSVHVRGALVESLIVGSAGELMVSVQTGSAESSPEAGAIPGPAPAAAVPDVGPAPVATAGASVTQLPASPRPAAPAYTAAPSPSVPTHGEPSRYNEDPYLLSRWRTAHGEVMERTLDASGLVIERQVDPPDGWQRAIDVSKLKLVSQGREDDGRIVQVVQDPSGAYIEVTRDPIGRFLQARVLRR